MIPCPICSNVIHEGSLTRTVAMAPIWHFARQTSARTGKDHYVFTGCNHACELVTNRVPLPHDERAMTEARWDVRARELLQRRTATWTEPEREQFARALGFRQEVQL